MSEWGIMQGKYYELTLQYIFSKSSTGVCKKIKPHQGPKKDFLAGQAFLTAHLPMVKSRHICLQVYH